MKETSQHGRATTHEVNCRYRAWRWRRAKGDPLKNGGACLLVALIL